MLMSPPYYFLGISKAYWWPRRGRAEKLLIPLLTDIAFYSSHVFCIPM